MRFVAGMVACLWVLGWSSPAGAQLDAGPGFDPFALPVTADEAAAFATDAGLGERGITTARGLVERCAAALTRDAKRAERAIDRAVLMHLDHDPAAVGTAIEEEQTRRKASHDKLETALLADLRALIPADQQEAWATLERRRHRRLYLFDSYRPGVRPDLVEISRTVEMAGDPAVLAVLQPYEVRLDQLLLDRHRLTAAGEGQPGLPADKVAAAYAAVRDADCAIIRLQRETAARLLKLAPESKRPRLQDLILRAQTSFEDGPSTTRRRADRLLRGGALDAVKRDTLLTSVQAYDAKVHSLDDANFIREEDGECDRSFEDSLTRRDNSAAFRWLDDQRLLDLELFRVISSVATESDLDLIDEVPQPWYDRLGTPVTLDEAAALAADTKLDDASAGALRGLVEGCDAQLRTLAMRERRERELAYLSHPRTERDLIKVANEQITRRHQESHDKASTQLVADLKSLISPDAGEAWAAFERRRHRRLYLPQSPRAGVRVDLVAVARECGVPGNAEVRRVLAPYELDLDRMLLARLPLVAEWNKEQWGPDQPSAERAFIALRDADCAILNLQRATAARLLDATPEETRPGVAAAILSARAPFGQPVSSVLERCERLIKSGRLEEARRAELARAASQWRQGRAALDETSYAVAEDAGCARVRASPDEETREMQAWQAALRGLDRALLTKLDSIATEADLNAIEEHSASR